MATQETFGTQTLAADKPRMRHTGEGKSWAPTTDSFQNFLTKTGVGTGNIGGGRYGFNPITRNRLQLEWAYRGSWIVGMITDCVAEDMTREGVTVHSDDKPDDIQQLERTIKRLKVWKQIQRVIKWARLYGGAVGVYMVDGQNLSTPLNKDSIQKGQFRGILPLDRWSLFPDLSHIVSEFGPHIGEPEWYDFRPDSQSGLKAARIHHTRLFRMVGVELPYWQTITENFWGQSVIERLWDRLVAFDSVTDGTAQLVYKAHLRTYGVKDLRKIVAAGGPALDGLVKQINMIRLFQSNEGMTLMDESDKFEVHPYSFSGLDLVLLQMGQQLSGASQIPLVRLFGQSPAGMNSTGESDLRTYYDGIARQQDSELLEGAMTTYELAYRSEFGRPPANNFSLDFKKLWQMDDEQRATVAVATTTAVQGAFEKNLIARSTALSELKEASAVTGMWTNITDEMIEEAKAEDDEKPPSPEDLLKLQAEYAQPAGDDPDGNGRQPANKGAGANGGGAAPVRAAA